MERCGIMTTRNVKKFPKEKEKRPARRSKEQPVRPAYAEKNSIIVLLVSAVIFLFAFFTIGQGNLPEGVLELFDPYGSENVTFEKATVNEILSEDLEVDEAAKDALKGSQELAVTIKSGGHKGEDIIAYNYIGALTGVPLSAGDSVILTIKDLDDGKLDATVYEFNRIPVLAVFLLLFCVIVVLIGGRTGLKSLIGLAFTVICLFTILIPLLFRGVPAMFSTFITCTYIAIVTFTVLGGVHRKTISAFLGTMSGAFLAMVIGSTVQDLAKINGFRLGDAEALYQLNYYLGTEIKIEGLLVAGLIISALGAVMDVAMSISSSLEEIHAANPSLSRKELFSSGMNIGRDMVGTMTNTLILALLGSEFTLIIFIYSRGLSFYHLSSTAFIAVETISGISSSIGMVLAIPLTAFISSSLITGKRTGI